MREGKFFSFATYDEKSANAFILGIKVGKHSKKVLETYRKASWFVEFFDVDRKENLLEGLRFCDVGDVSISSYRDWRKVEELVEGILSLKRFVVTFSRAHLTSYFTFKGASRFVDKFVVFDAHADLKSSYVDSKVREMDWMSKERVRKALNDATWLRRFKEEYPQKKVLLLGLRSCDEEEYGILSEAGDGIKFATSLQIEESFGKVRKLVKSFSKRGENVYLSVDIDCFDPSFTPAVDYPEASGISFRTFQKCVQAINGKIVGADFACINSIESNMVTEFLVMRAFNEVCKKVKTTIPQT